MSTSTLSARNVRLAKDPKAPCPVLLVQISYNYDQLKKGNEQLREAMQILVDADGNCKMKPVIEEAMGIGKRKEPVMPAMREWAEKRGII